MLMTPETKPCVPIEPRIAVVSSPMVQPMLAIAYATPKTNIARVERSFLAPGREVANDGFHPNNMDIPKQTSAIPMANPAYLAWSSIHCVNSREIDPTTRNTARNPDETAALTRNARCNGARVTP